MAINTPVLIGGLLWVGAISAAVRIGWILAVRVRTQRFSALAWLGLLLLAAMLLAKPHEDIWGGEDPGAYLNGGVTFGRQGKFFYQDPLLALVNPAVRPLFYFGHSGYGPTKDACLWLCNEQTALIGPHFQPAYPLLIAFLTRITGLPQAALYVVPIFAVLLAMALAALVQILLPRFSWAGATAALLLLCNPFFIWHARAPRPEIMAAFFLFAGIALLINRLATDTPREADVWLGGTALCLAPFFHITAWYAVLPMLAMTLLLIGAGRREYLPVFMLAALALLGLEAQSLFITDYYQLGHRLRHLLGIPWTWVGLGMAAGVLMAGGQCFKILSRRQGGARLELFAGILAAAAGISLPIWLYFYGHTDGRLPLLERPLEHMLYLTDFQVVANMLSRPISILALTGWTVWCLWPDKSSNSGLRLIRTGLAMAILPAVLAAGCMRDFMMTRYLLVTLVPCLTLCLAALIGIILNALEKIPVSRPACCFILAAIIGLLCHGRLHLVTTTNYSGMYRFLAPFAAEITKTRGVLIAEYSRLAAPLEHFFGIPVLSIDNERRDNYASMEAEIERLMRLFPDVPVFFMTPFHAPLSDRFVFTPVRSSAWNYQRLRQAGRHLPREVRTNELHVTLYRMRLADAPGAKQPTWDWRHPYFAKFDQGNMGLRGFDGLRSGAWDIRSARLDEIVKSQGSGMLSRNDGMLIAICTGRQNGDLPGCFETHGWMFCRNTALSADGAGGLVPSAEVVGLPVFGSSGTDNTAGDLMDKLPPALIMRRRLPITVARWTRATAAIFLPRPPTATGQVLLLVRPPASDDKKGRILRLTADNREISRQTFTEEDWRWVAAPFGLTDGNTNTVWCWLGMETVPAWNPKNPKFPADLGMLIGAIAVVP